MSPCAAENLTVLELDNCPLVTDSSLEHLISCHNLQRVELYDCQLITRNGIRKLRVSRYLLEGFFKIKNFFGSYVFLYFFYKYFNVT